MPYKDPAVAKQHSSEWHKKDYLEHRSEILEATKAYRRTHPKVNRGRRGKRAACHPDRPHRAYGLCQQCYQKQWQARAYMSNEQFCKSRSLSDLKARLKRYYKMSLEQFQALWESQQGLCAICQQPFARLPHVDHDHRSQKVRALLCKYCNCDLLGILETNNAKILPALRYLDSHGALPEMFVSLRSLL